MEPLLKWLTLPAASAYFYNDVLAIISILGSLILFLGAFPRSPFSQLKGLAEWYIAPLIFGTFFQFCFLFSGLGVDTETMGLLMPMPPWLITMLFALSFSLLLGQRWLRQKAAPHV